MCAIRINLGLTINAGELLTLSRRLIFGGFVIALGLIGKSLFAVKLENETCSVLGGQASV